MKKTLIILLISSFIVLALFVYHFVTFSDKKLHIVFCNVGQGDAIYIRTPSGADMLIDGGPDGSVLTCLTKHMPMWDKRIDVVFLSHPHADHATGLIEVMRHYKVSKLYYSTLSYSSPVVDAFEKELHKALIPFSATDVGDYYTVSDLSVEILWPPKQKSEVIHTDPNLVSLVQLIKYKDFEFLVTGDVEVEQYENAIKTVQDIDVLKVPHQGSKTGLNTQALARLRPDIAVISVGENTYGHPAKSILNLLSTHKIPYKRTDINGTIEIVTDGERIEVITQR
jgi:competence protein ComEC